jgi:opacity protein-like surface antigen
MYSATVRKAQPKWWLMALCALVLTPDISEAQGFGIGARMAIVRADSAVDDDSVRFFGGQIRLTGQRAGLEVSLDRRSESFDLLNEKVTETPIQASVLVFLGRGGFKPYVLGGPGWYKRKVEPIDDPDDLIDDVSNTEFGWHAGLGAEFRPGRHFGIHGDYRYTFLDFSDDDDDDDESFIGGLLPSHAGSMWTVGVTIYF